MSEERQRKGIGAKLREKEKYGTWKYTKYVHVKAHEFVKWLDGFYDAIEVPESIKTVVLENYKYEFTITEDGKEFLVFTKEDSKLVDRTTGKIVENPESEE